MVTKDDVEFLAKKYGISVKEMNRLNKDLWYHGTTKEDAKSICSMGVICDYNIGSQLDFGSGFYLTDTQERASSYISRIPEAISPEEFVERKEWAVVEFAFNPCEYLLANIDLPIKILNLPKHDEQFAEFVFDNRVKNVYNENPHNYDIIWGVMSDSLPIEIVAAYSRGLMSREEAVQKLKKPNSMKQLYLGTQELCAKLEVTQIIYGKKEE